MKYKRDIIDSIIENETTCFALGKTREAGYWTEKLLEATNHQAIWYTE